MSSKKVDEEEAQRIVEMAEQGMGPTEIGNKIGRAAGTVSLWIERKGVKKQYRRGDVTPEELERMKALRAEGKSYTVIAKETARPLSTVHRQLVGVPGLQDPKLKRGPKPKKKPKRRRMPVTEEQKVRIAELRSRGWPYQKIADEVGVKYQSTVGLHCRKLGLDGDLRNENTRKRLKQASMPWEPEPKPELEAPPAHLMKDGPPAGADFKAALVTWMEANGVVAIRKTDDGRLLMTVRKEVEL